MPPNWTILLPHMILAAGGFLIWCAPIVNVRGSVMLFWIAAAAAAGSGASALLCAAAGPSFQGMLDGSGYARYFQVLISAITLLTLFFSFRYTRLHGLFGDEYYGLVLFAALGMALASSALNWIVFFLGLEMLSISFYILIGCRKGEPLGNEAAIKYFIMGSVASGFLVFGIAVLFAATGSFDIAQSLGAGVTGANLPGALLGTGLIVAAIGFKVSLAPFHLWTPDVYQGAPAPVTAFLSTGSKVALFAALLRFALNMSGGLWGYFSPALWVMAALTMVAGNVTALVQTHLKRLLAYSSIAQMGYVLMAFLAAKQAGAPAIMFFLAAYLLMDLGAFGTVSLLSGPETDLDAIEDYRGAGYSHPASGALLAVCLFSLAGFPPAAGFIGKIMLFKAALQAGYTGLAILGIVTAIVSVYFYLNVIVALYMRGGEAGAPVSSPEPMGAVAGWAVLALIILLGVFPSPLLTTITKILYALGI
jgi:NADH-quinone oxidoreductase subunit N